VSVKYKATVASGVGGIERGVCTVCMQLLVVYYIGQKETRRRVESQKVIAVIQEEICCRAFCECYWG